MRAQGGMTIRPNYEGIIKKLKPIFGLKMKVV